MPELCNIIPLFLCGQYVLYVLLLYISMLLAIGTKGKKAVEDMKETNSKTPKKKTSKKFIPFSIIKKGNTFNHF